MPRRNSGFLNLSPVAVFVLDNSVSCESCPVHRRTYSSLLGLFTLDPSSTRMLLSPPCPGIASLPWGAKWLPVENLWAKWLLVCSIISWRYQWVVTEKLVFIEVPLGARHCAQHFHSFIPQANVWVSVLLGTESVLWTKHWKVPAPMELPFWWRDGRIEIITQT